MDCGLTFGTLFDAAAADEVDAAEVLTAEAVPDEVAADDVLELASPSWPANIFSIKDSMIGANMLPISKPELELELELEPERGSDELEDRLLLMFINDKICSKDLSRSLVDVADVVVVVFCEASPDTELEEGMVLFVFIMVLPV